MGLSHPYDGFRIERRAGLQIYRSGHSYVPAELRTLHGGNWLEVLSHRILGRRERQIWAALGDSENRRVDWILGRLAAKEAVLANLAESTRRTLETVDIEILPDAEGRPTLFGPWIGPETPAPLVSIAHSGDEAVAVAGIIDLPEGRLSGIGIDMEPVERMDDIVAALTLSRTEKDLLSAHGLPAEWVIRLWCAKEAVGKALGTGVLGGPLSLEAVALHEKSGGLEMALRGALAQRFFSRSPLEVRSECTDGVVYALAILRENEVHRVGPK